MELPWRHVFIFEVPIWGFEISIFTAAILVFWNRMQWELVLTVKLHAFSLMAVIRQWAFRIYSSFLKYSTVNFIFNDFFYLIFILNKMSSWVCKLNASSCFPIGFNYKFPPDGHRWVQVKGMYALASLFRPQKLQPSFRLSILGWSNALLMVCSYLICLLVSNDTV